MNPTLETIERTAQDAGALPEAATFDAPPFEAGPDIGYYLREIALAHGGGQIGVAERFIREMQAEIAPQPKVELVDAADWIDTEPPPSDGVLRDVFDTGDKMPIIGSSKTRKTFFALLLALCLATGRAHFLRWEIPKARRVLFVQMEVKESHFWRRVFSMARALGISPDEMGDRLAVANLRGRELSPMALIELAQRHRAEVVIVDPIYKLLQGDENLAKDVKPLLAAFDAITEKTGAAVLYVHHNAKGAAGDKDTRDRGAGSGVIARDFDAAIYLTEHRDAGEMLVVETLLRNYPPQAPFTIRWQDGCFVADSEVAPIVRTSNNRTKAGSAALPSDEVALTLATANGAQTGIALRETLHRLGFSKHRADALRDRLTTSKALDVFNEPKFQGSRWFGTPAQIEAKRREYENPTLKGAK